MSTTYEYVTGKIERDFKFIRYGEKCKRSGLPCYAGHEGRYQKCRYFAGLLTSFDLRHAWRVEDSDFVRCMHPEAQDSEGSEAYRAAWAEAFKYEALSHFDD